MSKIGRTIRERVPKIITNIIFLFATWLIANLISPLVLSLGSQLNLYGVSLGAGALVMIVFAAILVYLIVRLIQDTLALVEVISIAAVGATPWIKEEGEDIIRAIKEIVMGLLLILVTPIVSLPSTFLGTVGVFITAVLQLVIVVSVILLFFDAGRILYKYVEHLSESVASKMASEAEKIGKKPRKKKRRKK